MLKERQRQRKKKLHVSDDEHTNGPLLSIDLVFGTFYRL